MTDYIEADAFQTDVFGQESNDLFMAGIADEILGTDYLDEMMVAYHGDDGQLAYEIGREIEDKLGDAGYTVVWSNGVFIYRTLDLPDDISDWMV